MATSTTRPSDPASDPAPVADRLDASSDPDFEDDIDDAGEPPELAYDPDEPSPVALVAAGLIGAAIGAGLGLLVSRAAVEEPGAGMGSYVLDLVPAPGPVGSRPPVACCSFVTRPRRR